MKKLYCLGCLLFLTACAGTPPAWWDPAGTYSNQANGVSAAQSEIQTPMVRARVKSAEPTEEEIEPMQDMYEEMNLPISSEGVESSAETNLEKETQAESKTQPQTQAPAPSDSAEEAEELSTTESLPEDGSLPAPSVLN